MTRGTVGLIDLWTGQHWEPLDVPAPMSETFLRLRPLPQDYWGLDAAPQYTGPKPICSGGTVTFRFHKTRSVYQIQKPGDCPGQGAAVQELLPETKGGHAPTGMYVWTDPGTDESATYYFTTNTGDLCEQGKSVDGLGKLVTATFNVAWEQKHGKRTTTFSRLSKLHRRHAFGDCDRSTLAWMS